MIRIPASNHASRAYAATARNARPRPPGSSDPAQTMLVGSARRRWSAAPGWWMDGYRGRVGPSLGTHDPLGVRALALESRGNRALLVNADVIGVDAALTRSLRRQVADACGVPPDAVLVTATHTHGGPAGIRRFGNEPPDARRQGDLVDLMVAAAVAAFHALRPCTVRYVEGDVSTVATNRRDPRGPAPTSLPIVFFDDARGATRAVVVGFACHPTVLDHTHQRYGADYPGGLMRAVRRGLGRHAEVLFLTGACGDINAGRLAPSHAEANRIGLVLAGEVLRRIADGKAIGGTLRADNTRWLEKTPLPAPGGTLVVPDLVALRETVDLPLKPFRPAETYDDELRVAERAAASASEPDRRAAYARLTALRAQASSAHLLARDAGLETTSLPAELQLLVLGGGVGIVGLPGEVFHAIGETLRAEWDGHLIVAAYANDYIGYLNVDEAFAEGGYEAGRAFAGPGTAARLLAAFRRMRGRALAGGAGGEPHAPATSIGGGR